MCGGIIETENQYGPYRTTENAGMENARLPISDTRKRGTKNSGLENAKMSMPHGEPKCTYSTYRLCV